MHPPSPLVFDLEIIHICNSVTPEYHLIALLPSSLARTEEATAHRARWSWLRELRPDRSLLVQFFSYQIELEAKPCGHCSRGDNERSE